VNLSHQEISLSTRL